LSIPGLFRRVSEKRPEKEREDNGRSKLKIVILLIAILFLIIGVLYQTGYLRLPGPLISLFTSTCALHADRSQSHDIPVEDNAAKVKIIRKKIKKNLSMPLSGETEPKDLKTLDRVPDNRPYAIQIKAYRDLEKEKGINRSYPGTWVPGTSLSALRE